VRPALRNERDLIELGHWTTRWPPSPVEGGNYPLRSGTLRAAQRRHKPE